MLSHGLLLSVALHATVGGFLSKRFFDLATAEAEDPEADALSILRIINWPIERQVLTASAIT